MTQQALLTLDTSGDTHQLPSTPPQTRADVRYIEARSRHPAGTTGIDRVTLE